MKCISSFSSVSLEIKHSYFYPNHHWSLESHQSIAEQLLWEMGATPYPMPWFIFHQQVWKETLDFTWWKQQAHNTDPSSP